MRLPLLVYWTISTVTATSTRDRTACYNYIDCLEQAQRQFKSCSGGTAMALSLERRSRVLKNLLGDKKHILTQCAGRLKKESLDFDTLQTLVNEDSRECFQKIPNVTDKPLQATCDYPLESARSRETPHAGCLVEFQQDRHRCERLLACCPEHNACAERMNALSIAYQLARKKSREISEKMMECITEEDAKEKEEKVLEFPRTVDQLKEEEVNHRDEKAERGKKEVDFPTLLPTTQSPEVTTDAPSKQYWVPNKIAHIDRTIIGKEEKSAPESEEGEEEEKSEDTPVEESARPAKISSKILPPSDGGMPFKRPDRAMRQRIQKRLQLTPSALLQRNREDFLQKYQKVRLELVKTTVVPTTASNEEVEKYSAEEEEKEEPREDRKVAIVKFLLEKANAEMTEKVITMLAVGDTKGLERLENEEKVRREKKKKATLRALPRESSSSEEGDSGGRKVSIENVIKQTLARVSDDHRAQKRELMKNIKTALVQQKESMENMAAVVSENEDEKSKEVHLVSVDAPTTTTTIQPSSTSPKTVEEREKQLLDKKEAKLSEELRQRIGLEEHFKIALGKESGESREEITSEAPVSSSEQPSTTTETLRKVDIRPAINHRLRVDSDVPVATTPTTTLRPVVDSESVSSTTLATVTIEEALSTTIRSIIDSQNATIATPDQVKKHFAKKRGKHGRRARRIKNIPNHQEPTEGFCLSYGQCEALVWEYQERCDRKFNPITVTFGIDDANLRNILLNNSKSESSVVTQVCLRPVDKSVHNSVLQLQHIERGVRKACLSLGRDKPTLKVNEKEECRALAHFSVIEMEDWLETTNGHTQANLAECQARTAGIAASCQELASCCSAVDACEEYISSSPVRKMRAEAISLLLAQQDDCEGRMERTLRQLHEHFRLRPAKH